MSVSVLPRPAPLTEDQHFAVAVGDINDSYQAFKPPSRVSVSQGAAKSFMVKKPGVAATLWSPDNTRYMVEPMDTLASRRHKAVVFVGPAQSGKTAGLGEGWVTHAVVNDPGDMLIVQMTEAKAREYSKQRIDRMLTASPDIRALLSSNARDDNTHDKTFRHGMWLRIGWPTASNLSSTSYRYVFLTDRDRMDDDIDGEGDPFDLATARTRTFMSRGMVCVESSPGRPIVDASWTPATPHEGPPCGGIVATYNKSDRRRWYWKCPDCRHSFEAKPGLDLFHLPPERELLDMVRTADLSLLAQKYSRAVCPHCGSLIEYRHRSHLNRGGRWLRDGLVWTPDDDIIGEGMTSDIAGFWLGGAAAAYQDWAAMVAKHLQGLRDYAMTGSETSLATAVNTDQGMPYLSRHLAEAQLNRKPPQERADESMERYICPDWTRCVTAAVDVQGGSNARFVVQVHASGPWMEQAVINRFEIKESMRPGMGTEFAPIDPANYPEDWDVLTEQLLRATYRTTDANREIRLRMLVVDSGGEAGATNNAYAWFRRVRKLGLQSRVRLYKGNAVKNAPAIKETMVGGRKTGEKGDIPLLLCNPNLISDAVDAGLKRQTPGPGYIHFPKWLPPAFYDELTAEQRDKNGVWKQIRKRNESFDLCRMIRVGLLSLGVDKIRDWNVVPDWLKPLEANSETITREQRQAIQTNTVIAQILDDPAAPAAPRRAVRRGRGRTSVGSSYVR